MNYLITNGEFLALRTTELTTLLFVFSVAINVRNLNDGLETIRFSPGSLTIAAGGTSKDGFGL
jgi:hypothetical protein